MKPLGQHNYEQFAERYIQRVETKPHNAYYDRPAVLSLLPDVRGKRVLDAGCGSGVYARWLLEHGADVIACDVTPQMIAHITATLKPQYGDRIDIYQADLSQPLSFLAANAVDLVIAPLVLDYIEDWGPLFREFYRVLRPGGTFVCSFGNPVFDYAYVQSDNYHQVELFEMEWGGFGEPRPTVRAYRRPLSAAINPLLEAGFVLNRVLEPLPTEEFKAADPEDYEKLRRHPGFLCLRAHVSPA